MPLFGTNGVVSRSQEPLPGVGCGRNSRKHQKEYRQFQAEIGPEAFKRPLLTHRNAITTGWKRVGKMSRDNSKARESILEEDLARNVSLSLHNSFCLNGNLERGHYPTRQRGCRSKENGCDPMNS